jgi:hypothetical protein
VDLKAEAHQIDLYHLTGVKSLSEIPERRILLGRISKANEALLEAYQADMKTELQVSDLKARHIPDYLVRAFERE